MKNITILFILLFSYIHASSLSREDITNMVLKIKEKRVGINLETLESTPNPFAIVEAVEEKAEEEHPKEVVPFAIKTETYELTAILNHAAFINKKWYKVGEELGSYRVEYIGKEHVTLGNKREKKQLNIPKNKKKFKMFKGN